MKIIEFENKQVSFFKSTETNNSVVYYRYILKLFYLI